MIYFVQAVFLAPRGLKRTGACREAAGSPGTGSWRPAWSASCADRPAATVLFPPAFSSACVHKRHFECGHRRGKVEAVLRDDASQLLRVHAPQSRRRDWTSRSSLRAPDRTSPRPVPPGSPVRECCPARSDSLSWAIISSVTVLRGMPSRRHVRSTKCRTSSGISSSRSRSGGI